MLNAFTFRQANMQDFASLKQLGIAAYTEYKDALSLEYWNLFYTSLQNDIELLELMQQSTIFVCENNTHQIVGMLFFLPSGQETFIYKKHWCSIRRLAVHPAYRGLGIAKKLINQSILFAKQHNEKTMALHTSEFMHRAKKIYEQMGFMQLKPIENLYGRKYWLYVFSI